MKGSFMKFQQKVKIEYTCMEENWFNMCSMILMQCCESNAENNSGEQVRH